MSVNNTERKIQDLLRQHRFQLVRQTKHLVYQEPGGRVFISPSTPSDWRAMKNQLSILQRVIANPPQPMVLAIEEYERETAAQIIAGQQKAQGAAPGMGSGKQRPSRGTGYSYVGEKLCEHGNPKRYPCALCAPVVSGEVEVGETRESRQAKRAQERRTAKLARREAKLQVKQAEEAEFQKMYGPFLSVVENFVREQGEKFTLEFETVVKHPTWQKDITYCEMPPPKPMKNYDQSKQWFEKNRPLMDIKDILHGYAQGTLDEKDKAIDLGVKDFQKYLGRSEDRARRLMKFTRNELKKYSDLSQLKKTLKIESKRCGRSENWDFNLAFSHLENRIQNWLCDVIDTSPNFVKKFEACGFWSVYIVGENLEFVFFENENNEACDEEIVNFTNLGVDVVKPEAVAA